MTKFRNGFNSCPQRSCFQQNQRKGFTLIELLVVIAIISILASILFPVFARARENARRTSCLSNMKQIGLGLMQYTQDYDERYPRAWGGLGADGRTGDPNDIETDTSKPGGVFKINAAAGGAADHYRTWMDYIYPYVKSTQLFRCPSYTSTYDYPHYGYSVAFSNFNYYGEVFGGPTGVRNVPISMAVVKRPAEVIAIAEYTGGYNYTTHPGNMYDYASRPSSNANYNLVTPHMNGGTAVYADGHAKWRSRGTILANVKSVSMTTCNINVTPPTPVNNASCSRAWNPYID